jgi:hypothetical protein
VTGSPADDERTAQDIARNHQRNRPSFDLGKQPGGHAFNRPCQKIVAQSVFMLTIVQPLLSARSSACSAPLV